MRANGAQKQSNMSSDQSFVEFVTDQMSGAGRISHRKMFGEYAIYKGEKVVALVCDNQLFVKPTPAGRKFIGNVEEAPAYPGAKPSFVVTDRVEDRDWLSELIRITERELPAPKPKKKLVQKPKARTTRPKKRGKK